MKIGSGLEVKLTIAGVGLQEWEETSDAEIETAKMDDAMSRFVLAVPGSTFAISIHVPRGVATNAQDRLRIHVYLDGKKATHGSYSAKKMLGKDFSAVCEGIKVVTPPGRELRRFQFSQLETHDDPTSADIDPKQFEELGTIRVDCRWVRKSPAHNAPQKSFEPLVDTSIAEKCLKGRAISNYTRSEPNPRLAVPTFCT
jgi:hypothetical protein